MLLDVKFHSQLPSFLDCIVLLISKSLELGRVPSMWKKAIVSPVFKSGDRSDVNNYRAISLTCILSKITEHIVCSNMWRFIDENNLISSHQHGFRTGYNTTTQLLHVAHHASLAMDNKDKYHIVSFDFSKAFDMVSHKLIIYKLKCLRFNDNCVQWISDWLHRRSSIVSVNGDVSYSFDVKSGVPQGSVLGPLLFNIYINDMLSCVNDSDCRLYADDTLLCSNVSINPNSLQTNVDALLHWANDWGMQFNSKKCVHIQIGQNKPDITLVLGNDSIPQSDSLRYLGVLIDSHLKWNSHISRMVAKANRSLGMLKRCLREAPVKTKLLALKTMVIPILEYASQVWSPHQINQKVKIDKVQRDGIRWVFRLRKSDSLTDRMHENGMISLSDRRDELDLSFLRKIESNSFKLNLDEYIQIDTHNHFTRGKTVSHHHRVNSWRYSYYNRVRDKVKAPLSNTN